MAKASWCSVNPTSGSGNGTVNVGASVHTGRSQRTTNVTVKATGVDDQPVAVTQLAKAEFVEISSLSVGKDGGNITVTGKTNSSKLTFSLGSGDIDVSLPENFSAGGATTENGAAISGDPGATAEFNFGIQLSIPENETIATKTRTVTVAANGGQSASATVSQAEGDPVLEVIPASLSIPADGTAQSLDVTSNTSWTVE